MARIKRTHIVAQPILHNHVLYSRGDSITFEAAIPDADIRELRDMGYLAGDRADELDAERAANLMQMGLKDMAPAEIKRLWKLFSKSPDQLREMEKAEARIKGDSAAARLANVDEARQAERPEPDTAADEDEDTAEED